MTGPALQVTDPAPFFTMELNSPFLTDPAGPVLNLFVSICQFKISKIFFPFEKQVNFLLLLLYRCLFCFLKIWLEIKQINKECKIYWYSTALNIKIWPAVVAELVRASSFIDVLYHTQGSRVRTRRDLFSIYDRI